MQSIRPLWVRVFLNEYCMKPVYVLLIFTNLFFMACNSRRYQGLTIKKGVLSVGVEINYPPMEYYDVDGVTPIGFDIDLAKALADRLGLEIRFIDTAWEGILAGLDSNRYDIAINITVLEERQERYNFTLPYIDSSIVIAVLGDSGIQINEPEEIEGFRIGFQNNTTAQYFTERLYAQGLRFVFYSYDSIINCFDDLRIGRIDMVVVDNIAAFYYTEKENSPYKVVWIGPTDEFIAIALKKGNTLLADALNMSLKELFEDGTMAEISYKHFNRDIVSGILFP